jgi:L-glutamine-phosphate cytidylyltransferase
MTTVARRAIIIAAGMGRRLSPYTDEAPKCLVPVAGRPILAWQLDALRRHGVDEFVIVRGYLGDVLTARATSLGPGIRFADNHEYRHNNILASLFCAEDDIEGEIIISYSDIIYTPGVVGALLAARHDIALVIDREFRTAYEGRTDHPLSEAEVSDLTDDGRVRRVGKRALPAEQAWGEFIGLAKLSARGTGWLRDAWRDLRGQYAQTPEAPFQRAPSFQVAYLTDILQHLIDSGHPVSPVEIRGCWREIDTVQDLERARALVGSAQEDWTS